MKKIAMLSAIALVFAGCFSPWQRNEGTFTVTTSPNAGNGGATVPWNPVYNIDDDLTHVITLSGGPGSDQTITVTGNQGVIISVPPGNWNITVKAYDKDGNMIAVGSANVEIKPGQNVPVVITMGPPPDTFNIAVVTVTAISGVTVPVTGRTPVTSITATEQYTGTVTWDPPVSGAFAERTVYTATISLTAKTGFKFEGVEENSFTVAGARATNAADSGVVTAVFPETFAQVHAQTPVIISQPADATVTHNRTHILFVAATVDDDGDLSYQWYSNNSASNSGGTAISGATDSTYNTPTDEIGVYYYFAEVTNTITDNLDGGNKTATIRSETVTLTIDNLIHAQTPVITSQPVSATMTLGTSETHRLSVVATVDDDGDLSYQWYRNTSLSNTDGTITIIDLATDSTYDAPADTPGTFYYFVEVINTIEDNHDGGNKTARIRSNPVTLTINVAANFDISFDQIADAADGDIIAHEVISLSGSNGPKTITLEVENPGQYSIIEWHIPSINVTARVSSFIIDSATEPFNKIGEYYLTLEVWKDGMPYSKTVIFTVIP